MSERNKDDLNMGTRVYVWNKMISKSPNLIYCFSGNNTFSSLKFNFISQVSDVSFVVIILTKYIHKTFDMCTIHMVQ